jgi:hypothetical protein
MAKQLTRQHQPVKQQTARRERREETRRQDQVRLATKRRRNIVIAAAIACVVVIGSVIGFTALTAKSSSSPSASDTPLAPSVGNIRCDAAEQLAFHIHAHLSISIDGKAVPLPAQIGITNNCFYWMHTHDASGIIHMEAPKQVQLKLGTFLELWRQQFSQLQYQNQLSSTAGWTVYVNGKPYNGDFNDIVLAPHQLITLAYNSPNAKPDTTFNWGQL